MPLKILFAGTPDFAVPCLQALIESPHEVIGVYTQPDRPAGRGRALHKSPIKTLAIEHALPVYQPESLKDEAAQHLVQTHHVDVMIVVAYGLLLPKPVLDSPKYGCINVHGSLLPSWRGAAPIQRAIEAGDKETGITIMQMDEGLDTGPMLHKIGCEIHKTDTSQDIHNRLSRLGAKALLATLDNMSNLKPQKQNDAQATHAAKIKKEEGKIDWRKPAKMLDCKIRAFNPWPMCYTKINDTQVRIWEASPLDEKHNVSPGTIIRSEKQGIDVATGAGVLRLQTLQLPGGKALSVAEVINSKKALFEQGHQFES